MIEILDAEVEETPGCNLRGYAIGGRLGYFSFGQNKNCTLVHGFPRSLTLAL
jgi:hypothetical protein